MNQLSFDLPLCRASDPITSYQTADKAKAFKATQGDLIVSVLREYGNLGKDGIAARCGLTGVAVARRIKELRECGRVVGTGRKAQSTTGNPEQEWGAV
jgi:hypothetical protein